MAASELFILKDHSDFDMDNFVVHYQYEDAVTEEMPSLIIRLSAKRGRFMTVTPKITHYDKIFARLTDINGDTIEDVFEVLKIKPMDHPGLGLVIELICSHQGWYVWQDHFAKQYQRQSGFEVTDDIFNSYNNSAGTLQPTFRNLGTVFNPVTGLGNDMSKATFNDYDFGNAEKKDWDGILETIDRLWAPISAKGEFEFFEARVRSAYNHGTGLDIDKLDISIFPSGFKNGALVTVDKADLLNRVFDVDGHLESETGFVIAAWAEGDAGTLPVAVSQYFSEKEEFLTAKTWVVSRVYKTGMRVQFNGSFYNAILDHTSTNDNDPEDTPSSTWSTAETFSPTTIYSISTKDKAQYWINSGLAGKDAGTDTGRAGIYDANAIIRDKIHRRTIVHWRGLDPALIPAELLKSGNPYRGFRVLVNGTGVGLWSGNDSFGKAFANNWVQYTGNEWKVFAVTADKWETLDQFEGKAWTRIGTTWTQGAPNPITGIFIAGADFDCQHRYAFLNPTTPDFGNTLGIEPAPDGTNSAVRIKFDYTNPALAEFDKRFFLGINFQFPFPPNSNAIPFGAVTLGDIFLLNTLDRNNMHLSSKDERGFVQGLDSKLRGAEDYGPLIAQRAWLTLILKNALGNIIAEGDFNWRLFYFDTSDNVMKIDRNHPHNDNVEEITFELNGAEIYRARGVTAFTPVKELEILNRFEWRNIIRGGIYISDYYDKEGRFQGPFSRIGALSTLSLGTVTGSAEMHIDAPHWVKPLLSVSHKSETRPERNLQPAFKQHPQVFNKVQNDNIVEALKKFHEFKKVNYDVRTVFRCNIKAGEHYYFTHTKLIDTTTDGKINTEKVVAKKVIYTRTKGKGEGGRKRLLISAKRFLP